MAKWTDLYSVCTVKITLDSTDITSYVDLSSVSVKDTGNTEIETASLSIVGSVPVSPPYEWMEVTIVLEWPGESPDTIIFGGYVTRDRKGFSRGINVVHDLKVEGYKTLLSRSKPFAQTWENTGVDGLIAALLVGGERSEFTVHPLTSTQTIQTWTIDYKETIASNIQRLCDENNLQWRVTWNKEIFVGDAASDLASFGIAQGSDSDYVNYFPVESVDVEQDGSEIVNGIFLRGGVTVSDNQKFTTHGTGTKTRFYLPYQPINSIVSVRVDGAVKSWGTIGYHNCSERDALVHFAAGYIEFCSAPGFLKDVSVEYTYLFQYTYTAQSVPSQTEYGKTLWKLVETPWISEDVQAAQYTDSVLSRQSYSPVRISSDVRRFGLRAGQTIPVKFTSLGINTTQIIESVGLSFDKSGKPRFDLRMGMSETLTNTLKGLAAQTTNVTGVSGSGSELGGYYASESENEVAIGYGSVSEGSNTVVVGKAATVSTHIFGALVTEVGGIRPSANSITALQLQNASGTNILDVDTTNSRVGIGNVAPAGLLSVGTASQFVVDGSGDIIKIKNLTYSWPATRPANGFLADDGSGNLSWTTLTGAGGVSGSGTDNYIPRWNGTTALENSIIYDSGTNVGIGTASPGARFTIKTPDSDSDILRIASRHAEGSYYLNLNNVVTSANVRYSFDVMNASVLHQNVLVFDRSYVGIGTTSPATALHVVGAATITGGIRPAIDSTTALQLQNASGTSILNIDTTNARVGVGTTSPTVKLDVGEGDFRAAGVTVYTLDRTFATGAIGDWVEIGKIATNYSAYWGKITVQGHWNDHLSVEQYEFYATYHDGGLSANWYALPIKEGKTHHGIAQQFAVDAKNVSTDGVYLRVRLAYGQTYAGAVYVTVETNSSLVQSSGSGSSGTVSGTLGNNTGFNFLTSSVGGWGPSTGGMVITNTGNVGIGTTAPATALHVVGAATITGGIRPAADSTTALQLQTAAGASVLNVDTTNGRVVLGPSALGAKLDIIGGLALSLVWSIPVLDSASFIGSSADGSPYPFDEYGNLVLASRTNSQRDIVFLTGNSSSVPTAQVVIKRTTGNVGIGTTAPVTPLHALSTTATTNALRDVLTLGTDVTGAGVGDVNLGPGILFQAESSTTAAQDQARILSYWSTATHATMASKLAFQTRTAGAALATAMTIDGAGNVGIGTTAPSAPLHVAGASILGVSEFGSYGDAGAQRWTKFATISLNGVYQNTHAEFNIQHRVTASKLIVEISNGDPYNARGAEKFILRNDWNSGMPATNIKIGRKDTGTQQNYDIWIKTENWASVLFSTPRFYHFNGAPQITYYSNVYSGNNGQDDPVATGYDGAHTVDENVYFRAGIRPTTDSTTALRFETASGTSILDIDTVGGNVGIGTTSPGTILHVQRTSADRDTASNILTLDNNSTAYPYQGFGGGLLIKGTDYHGVARDYANISGIIDGAGTWNPGSPDPSFGAALTFQTAAIGGTMTERMRIDSLGKVGINTTAPATVLHVVGAATITGGIRPAADGTTAMQLQTASGTSVLNVDTTNGRVGIGTTSPTASLEIAKAVVGNFNGALIQNNEWGASTYLSANSISLSFARSYLHITGQITSSNATDGSFSAGYLAFSTRTSETVSERMRIDQYGNVGIGTVGPVAGLHVSKTQTNTGFRALVLQNNDASERVNSIVYQDFVTGNTATPRARFLAGGEVDWSGYSGFLSIQTQNSSGILAEAIRIDSAQKVGIRTLPDYTLDVNGTLRSRYMMTSFTVGGDTSHYYPVLITTAVLYSNATWWIHYHNFEISRDDVHQGETFMGSFRLRVKAQASSWGHRPKKIEEITYITGYGTHSDPVGDVQVAQYIEYVIVWLKGGMTYQIRNLEPNTGSLLVDGNPTGVAKTGQNDETWNIITTQSRMILLAKNSIWSELSKTAVQLRGATDIVWDGTSDSPSQLRAMGGADDGKRVSIGFDTTSNFGFIQSSWVGQNWRPLSLNPGGGNVGIGTTNPGATLQIGTGTNPDVGLRSYSIRARHIDGSHYDGSWGDDTLYLSYSTAGYGVQIGDTGIDHPLILYGPAKIGGGIRPIANSTNAIQLQNASGTALVTLDTTNNILKTTGYIDGGTFASGTSGYRLNGATGDAEFNNITARGALNVTILQYGQVLATNGSIWVTPTSGQTRDSTDVVTGTYFMIRIVDPDGMTHAAAGSLWASGDIIRLKEPLVGDVWARVDGLLDGTDYWILAALQMSPGINCTFPAGGTVLNYKQSGAGMIRMTADATYSPYISIATHAGSPWSALTERVRLGNLDGISGASGYGLWTDNGFFTGTVHANAGDIAGWTIVSGHLYSGADANRTGLRPADYPFYAGAVDPSTAPFRVTPAGALTATNATISGSVTATTGTIGGWTLGATALTAGSGATTVGLDSGGTDPSFYAGSATPGSAPFRVTSAGALTATNANITGTVNWAEGKGILDTRGITQDMGGDTVLSTPYGGIGATQNLLDYSNDFSSWIDASCTVTANDALGPTEIVDADKLVFGSPGYVQLDTITNGTVPDGYVFSVWLKAASTVNVDLKLEISMNDRNTATVAVDTTWRRFSVYCYSTFLPYAGYVQIIGSGVTVWAWGAQLEKIDFGRVTPSIYSPIYRSAKQRGVFFSNLWATNPTLQWGDGTVAGSISYSSSKIQMSATQITGALTVTGGIKPASNSTTALQLQNASGTSILDIDTTNARVGIGVTAPAAKLHVDQSGSTATIPVLIVEQNDVSEEFIHFVGTSTTDASQSLVDAADMPVPGSLKGWLKIYVTDKASSGAIDDGVYWIPFYSDPTA